MVPRHLRSGQHRAAGVQDFSCVSCLVCRSRFSTTGVDPYQHTAQQEFVFGKFWPIRPSRVVLCDAILRVVPAEWARRSMQARICTLLTNRIHCWSACLQIATWTNPHPRPPIRATCHVQADRQAHKQGTTQANRHTNPVAHRPPSPGHATKPLRTDEVASHQTDVVDLFAVVISQ